VVTPDVDWIQGGHSGKYTLNSVLGAADYMAKLPYVNASKMGVIGHSWGGFQNNYIVSHSNRFAAAVTGAGHSDMVGSYGLPTHGGHPSFDMSYDKAPGGLTKYLEIYADNSAKIQAENIITPLLIMHNKSDDAVPYNQGLGLFYTMYQLKKKVWMIEYDGEGHSLRNEENALDWSIRQKQFFDHYLMDKPAPIWMTRGLSAARKGYEDALQLDNTIKTP
jgi:dipeptidyl aminopeptidase/acylaminoacyl peptidase